MPTTSPDQDRGRTRSPDEGKKARRPWRFMLRVLRVAAMVYVALGMILFGFQSRLLYFPTRELDATPAEGGMAYEDVTLTAEDGVKLHAWFVPASSSRGAMLFCHGNAGNISQRLDSIRQFHEMGLDVLIFDYRGYGLSEGKPSENGTGRDAEAAWRHLVEARGIPPERIVVFGRSLGAAVAANLARDKRPAALIMESAFTSVPDVAARMVPIFPIRWICRFKYDNIQAVARLRCPLLVVHSRQDDLIPFAHGRRVFEAAGEPKEFLDISGSHNDGFLVSGRTYLDGLDRFITGCLPPVLQAKQPDLGDPPPPPNVKVLHVFVCLCDNRNQGIVPVPEALGNGQDLAGNLYWGAMYGVKTFLSQSEHWARVACDGPGSAAILKRCVFAAKTGGRSVYLVADAYDGARMKEALGDFLRAAAGAGEASVRAELNGRQLRLAAGGQADLVCFVGHNGLMDNRLDELPTDAGRRGPAAAVVLACKSHEYFVEPLRRAGCEPLITTAGLMAPEAYTLDAIVRSWASGDAPEATREKAAKAYAKYQRCGLAAARRLFVAGWGSGQEGSP